MSLDNLVVLGGFAAHAANSTLVCCVAYPIARTLGVMDMPQAASHKTHAAPTPLVGGLAILLPMIVVMALFSVRPSLGGYGPGEARILWSMAISLTALMALGLFDDRHHLSPTLRLAVSALVYLALLFYSPALQIRQLSFPCLGFRLDTGLWGLPFSIFCLMVLQNAVNMADGRNGVVIGMALIWCLALLSVGAATYFPIVILLALGLGITLLFNLKGKLFLGDCGTYGLAFLIGVLAVLYHADPANGISSSQNACLFIIPVLDLGRLMVVRLHAGRGAFAPDQNHLHHRLDRCCGWPRGLVVYWALVALPVLVGWSGHEHGILGLIVGIVSYGVMIAATDGPRLSVLRPA